MAKQKYVLVGPEALATGGMPTTRELVTYEGDSIEVVGNFVTINDNQAEGFKVAVIRLAEGQSIKRKE